MAEREVRYCTTEDGVRIAYCVEGEGPPLVVCQYLAESQSLDHLMPWYAGMMKRLSTSAQLIRFDMRGTGLSDRDVDDFSMQGRAADIEAVARAAKLKRFALWGAGTSVPRVIEYAARHQRQVERLILYAAFARFTDVVRIEVIKSLAQFAEENWPAASQAIADTTRQVRRESGEMGVSTGDLNRKSIDGRQFSLFVTSLANEDVTGRLGVIRCPTLILHQTQDPVYPFHNAQRMAARIKDCRLVPLPGRLSFFDEPQEVAEAVERFLEEGVGSKVGTPQAASSPTHSAFRTVLFTDLVGHTEMMSRLGDERGRDVLREHERITREVLKAHGGTEVKTMGDGFMASFGSVTKAVECAVALQRAFADREGEPLNVRVGLNAGEPIEEDGDLFGATVILASRIAAKAEGGEILVADTVRGLCSGKGFLFADRGEFVAKGFEEPVRVYEVRWRE